MNHQEKENVASAINYFWNGLVKPHMVNENSAKVLYDALAEAQSCSASIDLVPRPTYGAAGMSYIVKQVAQIGLRIASGDTRVYDSCRNAVAARFRGKMDMALQGL